MKEIVIMAGAKDPEKKFLSALRKLFPECAIRIVYAGSDREECCINVWASSKEMWGYPLRPAFSACQPVLNCGANNRVSIYLRHRQEANN